MPAFIPNTTPLEFIDATVGFELDHVPPVVGMKVVVCPAQMALTPVSVITGLSKTVMVLLAILVQAPETSIYVMETVPSDTPVTIPVLLTVAISVFELDQVPPGNEATSEIFETSQTKSGPEMVTADAALTETEAVAFDVHNVVELVKVKLADPGPTAVTTPLFVTVATEVFELVQVPPDVGDRFVVEPTQILDGPVILTAGLALTVIGVVALDGQLVTELVNTNDAVP